VQVAGFALGGLIVAAIGSSPALYLNALTFLASAVLVRTGVGVQRPQHDVDSTGAPTTMRRRRTRLRWRDPRLLGLVALLWLYGFYIAPEGIAAPYVEQLGADATAVGLLMAADPIGAGIGALVLSRWCGPRLRPRLIGPLAAAAGLPLIIGTAVPSVPWVVAFWALSGALSSHTVLVAAELAHIVPDDQRARAFGIASAGLQTAQGVGVLVAGSIADMLSPTLAVAMCGAAGTVCAICAGVVWRRAGDAGAREA
jgi:MFS family permease